METITVKMAKPDEKDFDAVLFFLQGIEAMLDENRIIESLDDGGVPFSEEAAIEWLEKHWKDAGGSWTRVLWAGKTAIDNCCDPVADVLEWHPKVTAVCEALRNLVETEGIKIGWPKAHEKAAMALKAMEYE